MLSRKIHSTRKLAAASAVAVALTVGGSAAAAQAASVKVIDYPSFNAGPELSLRGTAALVKPVGRPKVLRLVKSKDHTVGAAWAGPKILPTKSFETTFGAQSQQLSQHGDGIAFVLQANGNKALGRDGGGMGYSGITPSLVVEFDTYKNSFDINANHVAIITSGYAEVQLVSANAPVGLVGSEYLATVSYTAATKNLRVYLKSAASAGPSILVINRTIDLTKAVGTGPVNVGFTAGNGTHYGTQDILNWTLVSG